MKLLRTKQVATLTGLSRMTIYRLEHRGAFPQRRRLGEHSVAWLESEITTWVNALPVASHRGVTHCDREPSLLAGTSPQH